MDAALGARRNALWAVWLERCGWAGTTFHKTTASQEDAAPSPRHGPACLPHTQGQGSPGHPLLAQGVRLVTTVAQDGGEGATPGARTRGQSHGNTPSEGAGPAHRPPNPHGKATFRPRESPEPTASAGPSLWENGVGRQWVSRALRGARERGPSQRNAAKPGGRPERKVPAVWGGAHAGGLAAWGAGGPCSLRPPLSWCPPLHPCLSLFLKKESPGLNVGPLEAYSFWFAFNNLALFFLVLFL